MPAALARWCGDYFHELDGELEVDAARRRASFTRTLSTSVNLVSSGSSSQRATCGCR